MRPVLSGLLCAAALLAAHQASAADGQAVYNQACAMCHNNLPPKIGDKAAWAPLIQKGNDAMVASVIKGTKGMPPRAGKKLSDEDIKSSTEYLLSKSQ